MIPYWTIWLIATVLRFAFGGHALANVRTGRSLAPIVRVTDRIGKSFCMQKSERAVAWLTENICIGDLPKEYGANFSLWKFDMARLDSLNVPLGEEYFVRGNGYDSILPLRIVDYLADVPVFRKLALFAKSPFYFHYRAGRFPDITQDDSPRRPEISGIASEMRGAKIGQVPPRYTE